MARGSDLHARTCATCAEVCERCAESCEQMGDDEQMRRCAEACRTCAQSCREMAGVTTCWARRSAVRRCWCWSRSAALASRSEEHTSELQSLMRISYAVFFLKKQTNPMTT